MGTEKRRKVWIDRFQTYLSVRLALYFVLYQIAVWTVFLLERQLVSRMEIIVGPAGVAVCFALLVVCAVALGFYFIWDAVKFTHRVVGPLVRFRKTINAVAAGEEVELLVLRQGDLLTDMRDDFNEMLRELERRGAVVVRSTGTRSEKPAAASPAPVA